jgi:autotransporter-associated beta strand protein
MNQLLQRALVILISALLPYTGIGATLFSANGGGLYNSASSWSPAQVPTQNDSVVVTPGNPITNNAYANAQSLTIEAGASLTLNGSAYITRHLRVFGSLNGPAPINFIGTGMTIGGTATIFHPGNFSVFGDLTVLAGTNIAKNGFIHLQSSGITFTNLGSITLNNGTVSIASGATFLNGAGSTLSVYSNIYGGGTLDASTVANTVVYRNNANSTYPTTAYHHLTYQAGTKNISADVTINGNLTIQNSTNITGNNFTFTVGGNWTNNLSGSNITNLNVIFNGSGTQTVNKGSTEIWTNVTKAGTGTVLLNCNIQINGNFSLNSGSFDVSTANRTISLAGSWNNSGGTFVPRSGRVVFFNSAAAGLTASSGNENFFEIQKVLGGTFTINNNITVSGPFSIFAGTFACAGSQNINLAGNWSNSGGTFSPGTGTVTLTNSAARTISKTSAPETFFHLTKTGAGTSTINSAITCGGNLTLSAGTFDVGTGNNSVSIAGDGTFNATFTRRLGTVTFNGSGAQSISTSTAVTFHNLTIANTGAGVTASAGVITIDNILTPTSGNFGTAAGCRVLLPSDATRTAIIGSGSGTFSGSGFEIYRFISARPANWHDFGSPVASTTLLDWDNEIYMSGVGGADGNACCPIFNSVYRYDEPVGDYVAITSVSTTLNPGTGYSIFLGDDLTSWAGTSVVNSIGTPNSGTQSFGLSFSGASLDPGGHLVGNPHAAHLDWDAIVGASTNLDGTFYMLDKL